MKKPRYALWNVLFVFIFYICIAHGEDKILIPSGQKIAFMGDSITANGWNQPGGYVKLVVDALSKQGITVTPIPAGVSGNTSKDMLARLDHDVLSKKPDWMTLSCGVNDVWHGVGGVELEPYKQNITAIVNQAKAAGIKVLILTSTPIGEEDNLNNHKLAAYNEFLRQLAKNDNLPLADLSAGFQQALKGFKTSSSSRFLTVDGVHMNTGGNIIMAEGCLRAFGFSDPALERTEQAWLTQSNTAMFATGSFDFRPNLGITLGQYRGLEELAKNRNTNLGRLNNTLWLQSLGEVMQTHADDALIDEDQVKKETHARLLLKIDKLVK